jgi:general secretion pathway protein J
MATSAPSCCGHFVSAPPRLAAEPAVRATIRGRPVGFTLLEMLVVVAVLGLLMVGLTEGSRVGVALWGAQQRRVGETAELDAGARILRLLLSAVPSPSPVAGGVAVAQNAFNGEADRLSFVGDLPTGLGTTQRADITIALRHGDLVLSWTPHRHEISFVPAPAPIDTDLISGVAELAIDYWGAAPGETAVWRSRWSGAVPPELVRIRLSFGKSDRRRWPDLIAPPAL